MKKIHSTPNDYLRSQQQRASAKRIATRIARSVRDFKAYDGEGITDVHEHKYVLMMNNENQYMYHLEGLSTLACLDYLVDTSKNHDIVNVCFGATYDVNMILKDVPMKRLEKLHKGHTISFHNFSLRYLPRKCFIIRRFKNYEKHYQYNEKNGKYELVSHEKCVLWDVFGFFGKSFLATLKEFFSKEELVEMHYTEIEEGKMRRSQFNLDELENFIIPYTKYEVDALEKLMYRLQDYLLQAGLVLKRWDGSGAIAAAGLEMHNIRKYYGEIPPDVQLASQYAYGGGRIELIKIGHFIAKTMYEMYLHHYDVISAYPAEMPELPDLSKGQWVRLTGNDVTLDIPSIALYKVYWNYPNTLPFYPFFYRLPDGQIIYPPEGYNWVYHKELFAAIKHVRAMGGSISILEQLMYIPFNDTKPFAFVKDYFEKRKLWKSQGIGAQLAVKLFLNSIYGKTAQTLGYEENEDGSIGKIPPFFNLLYAGLMTSGCRAKLFDAAMDAPNSVVGFATDGIWSIRKLDVPISDNLGDWEYERLIQGTFVQAGVYWTTNENGKTIPKYRGFDKDSLTEDMVLEAWAKKETVIEVPSTRFVTLGSALASPERFKNKWRTWDTMNRKLDISGKSEKRFPVNGEPHKRLVPTSAKFNPMMFMAGQHGIVNPFNYFAAHGTLPDELLSRKHYIPWIDKVPKSKELEVQDAIADEIYDSQL